MKQLEPAAERVLYDTISAALESTRDSTTFHSYECFADGDLSPGIRSDLTKLFAKHKFQRVSLESWKNSSMYIRAWDRKQSPVRKVVPLKRKTA